MNIFEMPIYETPFKPGDSIAMNGRPYWQYGYNEGASVFFRYLVEKHGLDEAKKIFMEQYAKNGVNEQYMNHLLSFVGGRLMKKLGER